MYHKNKYLNLKNENDPESLFNDEPFLKNIGLKVETSPIKKIGVCVKCGEYDEVREHHYKGYGNNETALYCRSCDFKAHHKAKREGRCKLSSKETSKISRASSARRYCKRAFKTKTTYTKLEKNAWMYERITYNIFTGHITVSSSIYTRVKRCS